MQFKNFEDLFFNFMFNNLELYHDVRKTFLCVHAYYFEQAEAKLKLYVWEFTKFQDENGNELPYISLLHFPFCIYVHSE